MTALIDSNVLIDVLSPASQWTQWSIDQLAEWAARGPLVINDVVYAEVSIGFERQESFDRSLAEIGIDLVPITRDALFAAGKAFQAYRRQAGRRDTILPDFFIGAHADALGIVLLTRDPRRFRAYFPDLQLVAP